MVGVSHRTIRRWNKDIVYVSFKNVVSLAKVLDMNVDELADLLLMDKSISIDKQKILKSFKALSDSETFLDLNARCLHLFYIFETL